MTRRRIEKVLVANRGEIAVRILRSLREEGIASVAVASEVDRDALFVRIADEVAFIGPAAPQASYLSGSRILAAAESTGADAIHPGYGFLAERAEFAEAVEKAGLVFIGPTPASIALMGDKSRAMEAAALAGVPVLPGRRDVDDAELEAAAKELGFPLLIKPSAGGGGKGMRRVENPAALLDAACQARREAKAAFGDDRLILERWVHPARHIEIQVVGDGRGAVAALGERECSLQRRHQKILEECPSPAVSNALREKLQEAAVRLGEQVKYRGAGTVEFLLAPDGSFFFLEMNTRLQVEHPVTEMVYGVDLVRAQLAVARGEGLDGLLGLKPRGHSIEMRLYAESPERGFLPTPGDVWRFIEPKGPGIRMDAGLEGAGSVSPDYDPMVGKLVVWGPDRPQAIQRARRALDETQLMGLESNLDFLRAILRTDWFEDGDFHTGTVESWIEAGEFPGPEPPIDDVLLILAARALRRRGRRRETAGLRHFSDPFEILGAERPTGEGS